MIRLPHSLLPGPGGGPARRLAPLPEGAEPRRLRRPAATHLRLDAGHACTPPTGPPPDTPLMMAILAPARAEAHQRAGRGPEPAYPSLGMGRAARARYPEGWDASRPGIVRETPSTPCSIRWSPNTWRPSWARWRRPATARACRSSWSASSGSSCCAACSGRGFRGCRSPRSRHLPPTLGHRDRLERVDCSWPLATSPRGHRAAVCTASMPGTSC